MYPPPPTSPRVRYYYIINGLLCMVGVVVIPNNPHHSLKGPFMYYTHQCIKTALFKIVSVVPQRGIKVTFNNVAYALGMKLS